MTGERFLKLHGEKLTGEEKELLTSLLKHKLVVSHHAEISPESTEKKIIYRYMLDFKEGNIGGSISIQMEA